MMSLYVSSSLSRGVSNSPHDLLRQCPWYGCDLASPLILFPRHSLGAYLTQLLKQLAPSPDLQRTLIVGLICLPHLLDIAKDAAN